MRLAENLKSIEVHSVKIFDCSIIIFMENKLEKKVLIIGSSACEYSLAKKMSELEEVSEVFLAPGNDAMMEFCTIVDIRETNVQELLEFALENAIDLTVAASELAIKNDVATLFQSNNQMIFAPTQESAAICLNKTIGKKFMYKTHIQCPKFAIYDKPSMAVDYAKKSGMPLVIKTEEHHENKGVLLCNAFSVAKTFIEELFGNDESRVIIEDYILGHEFSYYVITDGYNAIPLGSVATYKHELEGDGGLLTSGQGAFSPDYKISRQVEQRIMQQIIYPTLNTLARQQTPYVGILGVDLIMNDREQLFAIEFNSFLQSPDSQSILALLDENLYQLFEACVVGSFADDYEQIDISDRYACSCVLSDRKEGAIISGLDDLDENTQVAHFNTKKNKYLEFETRGGRTLVLTRTARVLSKAVDDLYEEISTVKFDGMKYRKDIAKV